MNVYYFEATDRTVYCYACPKYLAFADIRITMRKHRINLCLRHVRELVGELVDASSVTKQAIYEELQVTRESVTVTNVQKLLPKTAIYQTTKERTNDTQGE
jgi:hypothetical protein